METSSNKMKKINTICFFTIGVFFIPFLMGQLIYIQPGIEPGFVFIQSAFVTLILSGLFYLFPSPQSSSKALFTICIIVNFIASYRIYKKHQQNPDYSINVDGFLEDKATLNDSIELVSKIFLKDSIEKAIDFKCDTIYRTVESGYHKPEALCNDSILDLKVACKLSNREKSKELFFIIVLRVKNVIGNDSINGYYYSPTLSLLSVALNKNSNEVRIVSSFRQEFSYPYFKINMSSEIVQSVLKENIRYVIVGHNYYRDPSNIFSKTENPEFWVNIFKK